MQKKAVLKVVEYLLHMKEWRITHDGQGCKLNLEAYADSNFRGYLDTRRSMSGAVMILAKEAVSWHSGVQIATASCSSEADYVALSEVAKVIFLRLVQNFMEPSMRIGAVDLVEDNGGANKLAVKKHAGRSTKHTDEKHHLARNVCDAGEVRVEYVRTEDQQADLFAKPLGMQKFCKHAKTVLNEVCAIQSWGILCAAHVFVVMIGSYILRAGTFNMPTSYQ